MNEMFKEIEEDMRRERTQRLWNSFGKLMVMASIAVIAATIAIVVWQDRKEDRSIEQTTQFIKGLDRLNVEDYKGAIEVFTSLAENGGSSYYGMSMLRKAQAQVALGDREGALKTYEALASHGPDDDAFVGLGRILAVDSSGKALEPVKSSPFYYSQQEWQAWQLVKDGKTKEALAVFEALHNDVASPASLRQRAGEIVAYLPPEQPNAK